MTLKWRMSNYTYCPLLNSKYFIYVCLISKSPKHTAACKKREDHGVIADNSLIRRNSTPTSFDILVAAINHLLDQLINQSKSLFPLDNVNKIK